VHATSKRRGHGEDSIYWNRSRKRYIGAVDLGLSPVGARIRKKVSGKAKAEVRDKLRELHKQVDAGLRRALRWDVVAWVHGQWQPEGEAGFDHEPVAVFVWRAGRSAVGTPLDDHNVRRQLQMITEAAGLGKTWVPRELRHTFVSLLSAHAVSAEEMALVVGHQQTATTE
jgi:integrase